MQSSELKAIRITLATIWLVTGVLSLGVYPKQDSLDLLARVGFYDAASQTVLYLASAMNIVLGLLTLFLNKRVLWLLQAMIITFYTLLITLWLPEFWLHPFGPILKNIAVLMLLWLLYRYEPTP